MKKAFISALAFVLLFNLLFFKVEIRLGAFLLAVFLNIVYFVNKNPKSKTLTPALVSSFLSCMFALGIGYRANGTVQFINFLTASFFSAVAFFLYKYEGTLFYDIVKFIFLPLDSAKNALVSAFDKDSYTWSEHAKKTDITGYITKGFIIAVPLFVIIFFLLISADPIFAKYTNIFIKDVGERLIISLVVFLGILIAGITQIRNQFEKAIEEKKLVLGKAYELFIIAGSISLLLLVFILFQIRYLFTTIGERELHTLGIAAATYSEYVRRGFFELIFVSAIVCAIILYVSRYLHSFSSKVKLYLRILTGFLTIETFFLVVSDAKRLQLYMTAHGLSEIRIFGIFFLSWLSLFILLLLVQIVKKQEKRVSFYGVLISTILVLCALNLFNMDEYIALKHPPTVNNMIDYPYLVSLSSDSYKNWPVIVNHVKDQVLYLEQHNASLKDESTRFYDTDYTLATLQAHIDRLKSKYSTMNPVSYNNFEYNAYSYVNSNEKIFKQLPDLRNRLNYLGDLMRKQQQTPAVTPTITPGKL